MAFDNENFHAPDGLRTDEFLLRPIREADAELDYEAVMESKESLRLWELATWPEDDFTVEANREDMVKLARRHDEGEAFGYTVMNLTETQCLGCVYMSPPDAKWLAGMQVSPVGDADWMQYDAVVSFWIRKSRLADGLDGRLLDELRRWLERDWPIQNHLIQTTEPFEQQVALLESTELQLRFRLQDPSKPGTLLAYSWGVTCSE